MSRRSTRGRRQGVIRKGVIRRQEDSGTSCSLESSFNIFYTRRISDIENELPQDATAEETMERAIMTWRHMSLRERSEWDHLANCRNQQYMDKNRIVSYFGISEKISSPLPSSKCSKRCYDDSDDDDDILFPLEVEVDVIVELAVDDMLETSQFLSR
mmetsp:Transcript_8039/g.11995  ORF Transcript_8039/g.11995 Transcript_8039/m.11995 type:complete len:157 (+) Transcript_8039:127-597(+)